MTPTTCDPDERLAYVALARIPGLGARRLASLLSRFHSPLGVLRTPFAFSGRDAELLSPLLADTGRTLRAARAFLDEVARLAIAVLVPGDPGFPPMLRSIPDPPTLLYAQGDLALLSRPAVAIVGSRDHSHYGRDTARLLAHAAARAGIVVVSGLARGLDAAAHQAALDAAGPTIGVLGCGIGFVYPVANRPLYDRIARDGLLLTESPPAVPPHHGAFPRRNRLISGLSQVLVVVEAARQSGTMLTVAAALEQGRTVMAVPGPISSTTSGGTNQLLRDGAEPLLSPDDLLAHFTVAAPREQASEVHVVVPSCTLSPEEARVFDALTVDPRHVDEVTHRAGLPVGTTLAILCGLELGGLVEQTIGCCFRRISSPSRGGPTGSKCISLDGR